MDTNAINQHEINSIGSSDGTETQYTESVPDADVNVDVDVNVDTGQPTSSNGDQRQRKIPFRRSLFFYVPPFVIFNAFDKKPEVRLPLEIKKHMKWLVTKVTPKLVRQVLHNSGYRLMKICGPSWCGTWGRHKTAEKFLNLTENQKINHFPGTFQIGRKDQMWRNFFRMYLQYGEKEYSFVPFTFVLPHELSKFWRIWKRHRDTKRWIIKPPASARGSGIRVVHRWEQIPKKRRVIVQEYIARPLLIRESKFDMRIYVFVTNFEPLRIYLYPEGLARFASTKYNIDDVNALSDRFMHLTNYSINKNSVNYTNSNDVDSVAGHKWTLSSLWSHLERKNVDVAKIQEEIKDIAVKTIIAGESAITDIISNNTTSRYTCFELFGLDILLEENLKPWLLEVNISPSLQSNSMLDTAVKGPLIKNVLNMAGFQLPIRIPAEDAQRISRKYKLTPVLQNCKLHTRCISYLEQQKQMSYIKMKNRPDYVDKIIEDLTPDDVRQLIMYEDELTQLDNFEKIFPTTTSYKYLRFFKKPKYYNMLFDAWESKYGNNREEGIMRLQKLCKVKYHLKE